MTHNTPFDTWLQTLGSLRADMPMTVRGLAVSHTVTYPGDVTSATLTGSVKASYDSTSELAVFTIGAPSFDAGTGLTSWTVSLSGSQTGALPADSDGDGRVDLVFDFLLTLSGGSPDRVFGGLFPVSGFVTEPA